MRLRQGATLLLALIILSGIVATSLTVGTVVVRGLRTVQAVDQSVLASYAAESGVEELLYAVRKFERRAGLEGTGTFENGASWRRTVEPMAREHFVTLDADAVEQLDLMPTTGALDPPVGVRALLLAADAPAADAWLEVTWTAWLNTGAWSPTAPRVLFAPAELAGEKIVDLQPPAAGGDAVAYRVRLRSIGGRVGSVRIRAASDRAGQQLVDFPSRLRATVVGTMGSARYASRVEFPTWSSAAPIFDYVLFSECDIVKGGQITCPP